MTADAGCGKSVLSSFLVDHLNGEVPGAETSALVCHFFIKDNSTQGNAINVLSAILNQIIVDSPGLLSHAYEEYKAQGSAFVENFDALWKIFINILEDKTRKGIFLVLDGLDECVNSNKIRLIDSIEGLHESLILAPDPQRKSHRKKLVAPVFFKCFITSRPDNPIKTAFQHMPRLRGEDEIEAIGHDVELVVSDSLESLNLPARFKTIVQDKLISGADQTHLWTTLIMNLLRDASINAVSESDIHSILNSRGIYDIYDHMLRRSSNSEQARTLLQILLAAQRPLTLDEINIALSIRSVHQTRTSILSEVKHPAENYIFSLCGHFIRVIRSKVYLVHQTAKEFLIDDPKNHSPSSSIASAWQNSMSIKESNNVLLNICMSRLAMFHVEIASSDDLGQLPQGGPLFTKVCAGYPLFEYAARYWPSHCIMAEADLDGILIMQTDYLCNDLSDESYSCIEPYLRAWTTDGSRFSSSLFEDTPVQDQRFARWVLEDMALHVLSRDVHFANGPRKTFLDLAVLNRSTDLITIHF